MFELGKRRLREDPTVAFHYLKGLRREKHTGFVVGPVGKGEGLMVLN